MSPEKDYSVQFDVWLFPIFAVPAYAVPIIGGMR
jgi:hypothetical protein